MDASKDRFTFKIILSYLVLGALAVVVSIFLYSQFKAYTEPNTDTSEDKKFIETGTLVNSLYETDSFSSLALLTLKEEDFEQYEGKVDTLFRKIEEIKQLTTNVLQKQQLDTVKSLLEDKTQNIEQLRLLKLTINQDTTLDDILFEFKKLEDRMGMIKPENFKKYSRLSRKTKEIIASYVELLNQNIQLDTIVSSKMVDSMLTASRYIVTEAKRENSRVRTALKEKENELIENDLTISAQLRQIITDFDAEVTRNNSLEKAKKAASVERTTTVLKWAGAFGTLVILLFTYVILTDFFRAEKFKKNLKEAKRYSDSLLKSREQLISTVSHDLKTPLNTIVGYSELFKSTSLSEKQNYYVDQITNSSDYVSRLVDDLLDFSKLEAGKLPLEHIPFSLEKLVKQTAEAAKDIHTRTKVALKIDIDESVVSTAFESDPLRIRQILSNLIGNAFKFTEQGIVSITVSQLKKDYDTATVLIKVSDTGIGISEKKQKLIFKEFTQAEVDTVQKFGGSGLGLTISKKLTQLLGGRLTVESTLGEGSTFSLKLPLRISEKSLEDAAINEELNATKLKAMVLDDDPAMRSLLKELLEQMGVTTETYSCFNDISESQNLAFDFVLTDIQMPQVNGFEVLERLKKQELSVYKNQPVIAMTGDRTYSKKDFLDKGFSDMLKKPFTKETLVNAINDLFDSGVEPVLSSDEIITPQTKSDHYDLSLLQSFLDNDEALNEILAMFFEHTEKDLLLIENGIKDKNLDIVNSTAHKMLTMFRQIQGEKVIPILEELEYCGYDNVDQTDLNDLFSRLKFEVDTVFNALQADEYLQL